MTHTQTDLVNVLDMKPEKYELGQLGDRFCDYSGYQYICDVITEIADNEIDIYTYNLFEWAKTNYEWVEEAIAQGLCDTSNPDIIKMLQAGQYEQNSSDLYNHLDASILNFCLNYIHYDLGHETMTQEQFDELDSRCTNVDNNDTLEDFEEFCNELFEEEEEEEDTHFCTYTNDTVFCNGICSQCQSNKEEIEE